MGRWTSQTSIKGGALKYIVIYCDGSGKCAGYHTKETYDEATKFAKLVSNNGWVVKIYEDIPLEIYEPERKVK
jgi:hypothetical protein